MKFDRKADWYRRLRENRGEAEAWRGMGRFGVSDRRALFEIAADVDAATGRGEAIVVAMVQAMRDNNVTLPASDTFERIALVARARARKSAYSQIARGLSGDQRDKIAQLHRKSVG